MISITVYSLSSSVFIVPWACFIPSARWAYTRSRWGCQEVFSEVEKKIWGHVFRQRLRRAQSDVTTDADQKKSQRMLAFLQNPRADYFLFLSVVMRPSRLVFAV